MVLFNHSLAGHIIGEIMSLLLFLVNLNMKADNLIFQLGDNFK